MFHLLPSCPSIFHLVLICSGIFHLVLICSGMFHLVPICSGMFHLVLICSGIFHLVLICSGMFQLVLICSGMFRPVLVWSIVFYVVLFTCNDFVLRHSVNICSVWFRLSYCESVSSVELVLGCQRLSISLVQDFKTVWNFLLSLLLLYSYVFVCIRSY